MYLETILILSKNGSNVRSIDVGEYMGFSKPSVSRAMSKLKEEQYITINKGGTIALTEKGQVVAEKIYERHILLTNFLKSLGVDDQTAAMDACKIEHDVSDKTIEAIRKHMTIL